MEGRLIVAASQGQTTKQNRDGKFLFSHILYLIKSEQNRTELSESTSLNSGLPPVKLQIRAAGSVGGNQNTGAATAP